MSNLFFNKAIVVQSRKITNYYNKKNRMHRSYKRLQNVTEGEINFFHFILDFNLNNVQFSEDWGDF